MSLVNDRRTILSTRSSVRDLEQRLTRAAEGAVKLTLGLRDISTLLTFMAAAKRLADVTVRPTTKMRMVKLEAENKKVTAAWLLAEHKLWMLEREREIQRSFAVD